MESAAFTIDVFKFVLLIFSLSVHECSHAWMASRLGDQTARLQGRVTLNPIYHIDPVGTIIMPAIIIFGPLIGFSLFSGILIGWAKPTPVISRNFTKIRRDENIVTLAGPASNMLLAVVATFVLLVVIHAVAGGRQVVMLTASGMLMPGVNPSVQAIVLLGIAAVEINLALFFFNLLPDSAARWQQSAQQHPALQRRAVLRPHSRLGQLVPDDLRRRLHHAPAAVPGLLRSSVWCLSKG